MKDVRQIIGILLLLAFVASACSPDTTPAASAAAQGDAQTDRVDAKGADASDPVSSEIEAADPQDQAPLAAADGQTSDSGSEDEAAVADGPDPVELPWKSKVPVKAKLSSDCVARGELMTLTVQTKPKAAIAFQAVYADNKGGADKPFGAGYGGNDKGNTGPDGRFTSSWVVSLDAPEGPARVDVIIGWGNKRTNKAEWGYAGPEFAVTASEKSGCDSKGKQ